MDPEDVPEEESELEGGAAFDDEADASWPVAELAAAEAGLEPVNRSWMA
jgi:hypothetical protein